MILGPDCRVRQIHGRGEFQQQVVRVCAPDAGDGAFPADLLFFLFLAQLRLGFSVKMVRLVRDQHDLPRFEILIGHGVFAADLATGCAAPDGGEVDVDRAIHPLVEIVHGPDIHQRIINPDLGRKQVLAGSRVRKLSLVFSMICDELTKKEEVPLPFGVKIQDQRRHQHRLAAAEVMWNRSCAGFGRFGYFSM